MVTCSLVAVCFAGLLSLSFIGAAEGRGGRPGNRAPLVTPPLDAPPMGPNGGVGGNEASNLGKPCTSNWACKSKRGEPKMKCGLYGQPNSEKVCVLESDYNDSAAQGKEKEAEERRRRDAETERRRVRLQEIGGEPTWASFSGKTATPVARGSPVTTVKGNPFELRSGEQYPSEEAKAAYAVGVTQGKASPKMGKTEAPTLFADLTTSFSASRVVTEARRKVPTMGTGNFLIDGRTKAATNNAIAQELKKFKEYIKLKDEWRHLSSVNPKVFMRGITPDMIAEKNYAKSLFCNGHVRPSGTKGLTSVWDPTAMNIGSRCANLGIAAELYTTGWPWYQMGLIAGWFDQDEHADYASIYGSVDLTHTVSFGNNVEVGMRSRGGGWHIDMAFDSKNENAAPLYFVSTDDHPTLFFKGKLGDYLDESDLTKLKAKEGNHEEYVKDVMGEAGLSGTYQAPHSIYPTPQHNEVSEKNVPDWVKTEAGLTEPTCMADVPLLAAEPPCQYMSGLINLKIFDAEMRTKPELICPKWTKNAQNKWDPTDDSIMGDATVTNANPPTCLKPMSVTVSSKTYPLGPQDNTFGGNFRKHVTNKPEHAKLADTSSPEYKAEVMEVPADLSLGLMGPYRIHNAGARYKDELKSHPRKCAPMDRMFSRIMMIPTTKTNVAGNEQRGKLLRKVKKVLDRNTPCFAEVGVLTKQLGFDKAYQDQDKISGAKAALKTCCEKGNCHTTNADIPDCAACKTSKSEWQAGGGGLRFKAPLKASLKKFQGAVKKVQLIKKVVNTWLDIMKEKMAHTD